MLKENRGARLPDAVPPLPVNSTNELGPLEEVTLPANKTSCTLHSLKYSTRYKFYLNANTVKGAGPAVTEETVIIMDEGKLYSVTQ